MPCKTRLLYQCKLISVYQQHSGNGLKARKFPGTVLDAILSLKPDVCLTLLFLNVWTTKICYEGKKMFITIANFVILIHRLIFMLLLSAQCGIRASGGRGISDLQSETDRAKQYFNHWFQKTVFTHREH